MSEPSTRLRVVPSGPARIAALEDEITSLAGHLAAATAVFLKLLAEFDRAEGWQSHGLRSCAQWLSWKCGMSAGTAREHVRVALSLTELPVVRQAFTEGKLSFSKVRAVTRVATPATEGDLVETAQACTASQLDRICSGIKSVRGNEEVVAHRAEARFTATWREDGMLSFSGRLAPEDGAALLAALASLKADPIRREATAEGSGGSGGSAGSGGVAGSGGSAGSGGPERAAGSARAASPPADGLPDDRFRDAAMLAARADSEALVMMARHCLGSPPAEVVSDPVRLIIRMQGTGDSHGAHALSDSDGNAPAGALRDRGNATAGAPEDAAVLDAGPAIPLLPLSPTTLDRLACDAIVEEASDPDAAAGAKPRHRFANRQQRRALLRRDGGCRFAGCSRKRGLHAHHVVHHSKGGPTVMANLILLCDHHHLLVHEGGWRLERAATGWIAVSPKGERHVDAPESAGDPTVIPRTHDAEIRPDTVTGRWAGERLDLRYVVGVFAGTADPGTGRQETEPAGGQPASADEGAARLDG